jgi:hypothetical protein
VKLTINFSFAFLKSCSFEQTLLNHSCLLEESFVIVKRLVWAVNTCFQQGLSHASIEPCIEAFIALKKTTSVLRQISYISINPVLIS